LKKLQRENQGYQLARFQSQNKYRHGFKQSQSKKAGLIFSVNLCKKMIKRSYKIKRFGPGASVYLTAVLEYLTAELLDLAGDIAFNFKKIRIIPRHIMMAIKQDIEFSELLKHVTLSSSGVLPIINKIETLKPEERKKLGTKERQKLIDDFMKLTQSGGIRANNENPQHQQQREQKEQPQQSENNGNNRRENNQEQNQENGADSGLGAGDSGRNQDNDDDDKNKKAPRDETNEQKETEQETETDTESESPATSQLSTSQVHEQEQITSETDAPVKKRGRGRPKKGEEKKHQQETTDTSATTSKTSKSRSRSRSKCKNLFF